MSGLRLLCRLVCVVGVGLGVAGAQAPVALPYTASTYAGTLNGATAVGAGKLCNGGGTPGTGNLLPVATDAFNDGCPAAQAIFSADIRGGVAADPLGNVYVADTTNGLIRKIDARSGLITVLVGGTVTVCAGAVDKTGDGCPVAQAGNFNNPRGIGSDPFGNIFIAGYSDQLVHMVCTAVSPICSSAQVGTMRLVAGCVAGATSYGTAESGPDGISAVSTGVTCNSTTTGGLNQPRGVSADVFGNIYIADTGNLRFRVVLGPATYNGVTNPLVNVLKTYSSYPSPVAGSIYALLGGSFTAPASGAACSSGSSFTASDANGDGCPFYNSKVSASGGAVQAIAVDGSGNVFFADGNSVLRVMYVGGATVAKAITLNNTSVTTPQLGFTYVLAGGGSNALATTSPVTYPVVLGTSATGLGNLYKITVDVLGNVYIGDASASSVDFYDMQAGTIRKLVVNASLCTTGATGTPNSIGDGCPATQINFSSGNGIGLAVDPQENLYFADVTHALIRKASSISFAPTALGTSETPGLFVHAQAGTTALTPTVATPTDFTLGTASCVTNATGGTAGVGDNSYDCVFPVTVSPSGIGLRTSNVSIAPTTSGTATTLSLGLSAIVSSDLLAFDPTSTSASTSTIATGAVTTGTADGNATYVVSGGAISKVVGSTVTALYTEAGGTPSSITTDSAGNLYYTLPGVATIAKLTFTPPSTYVKSTIAVGSVTPAAVVASPQGNLYFYDSTSKQLMRYTAQNGAIATLTTTAFNNVKSLALDALGNILVADSGAGAVYRVPSNGGTQTAVTVTPVGTNSGIVPVSVASDAAGDVYVADTNSQSVQMISLSGPQTTVVSGFTAIKAVLLDSSENVYVADSSSTNLTKVNRSQFSYTFPNTSTNLTGVLTNAGNLNATGFVQSDAANFSLFNSPATCTASSALVTGAGCTINAAFLPPSSGGGTLVGTVQPAPAASAGSTLTMTATVAGNAVTTGTVIGGQTPASGLTYAASGTEVAFTVTVTASSGTPTGSVNVSVDGATAVAYALTAGSGTTATATVALSGLIAATHTISATYPTTGAFNGSTTASATNFTIAPASTVITWSPSATTQQYSAAIGTGVFDAYASSGSTVVPGAFVYTATPSGGSAAMVDASTYLAIGGYTLAVTFTPTDAVDYTGSTSTLSGTYTVTKATTTAGIGASQFVVAADGSGNYTSVEAAVTALPTTGGNVYVAPGTYTGQVLVAYPNVGLHGLGGNAANVVITSETGAFGGANASLGIAANPFGFNNDEGSATLVVSKGTVNSTSYTPTNFYMDNLSLINTFDTDSTNTNAISGSNQSCTAVTSSSNNTLYNAGTLCASQALTLWITADKSVLNNVRMTSLQDTLAAYNTTGSNACSGIACSSRQYYWKNYITGDIDYVFGDAAAVFDQTSFYTTYHNGSNTGNATVFAQNKAQQTGSSGDYLSGYVANNSSFTSQMTPMGAMTALNYGRPYGEYSTTALINDSVDDVVAAGWEPFSGANLATATYIEFGTTGAGAATIGSRETMSVQPSVATSAAQIAKYLPVTFLSSPAPDVWNPVAALATGVNGYVPASSAATITYGQSITILAKPQTPGGGAIPTGTYTVSDGGTQIASGTLDASGAMYLTKSTFTVGTHNLTMTYSGDANFSGYTTTATPFVLTVNGTSTTTTVAVTTSSPTYGQAVTVTATVTPSSGATPTGNVSLSVDSGTPVSGSLSNGVATFSLTGLSAGAHTLSATYAGAGADTTSTGTGSVTLATAALTVTAISGARSYGGPIVITYSISGYVNNDPSTVVSGTPALSTTAVYNSPAGNYPITAALGTLAASNYSFSFVGGTLQVNGGYAQTITLLKLPNLPHGITVPLYGRASSGLPVTYTVSGAATIVNNSYLQITGTGLITVTANQNGNATFSAATSVSRSFTAQ